jgi:hypothetical protein
VASKKCHSSRLVLCFKWGVAYFAPKPGEQNQNHALYGGDIQAFSNPGGETQFFTANRLIINGYFFLRNWLEKVSLRQIFCRCVEKIFRVYPARDDQKYLARFCVSW